VPNSDKDNMIWINPMNFSNKRQLLKIIGYSSLPAAENGIIELVDQVEDYGQKWQMIAKLKVSENYCQNVLTRVEN